MIILQKKKFIVLVLFCLVSVSAYNQLKTYKGYIITVEGDSISGRIKHNKNLFRNNEIMFYPFSESRKYTNYKPQDVKLFRFVDNKYFVPLTIERDKIKKELFVELIFDGVISIYYSDYLNEYYIKNEKGEVFILHNKSFDHSSNGKLYNSKSNKYIGIIKNIFRNDLSTIKLINNKNFHLNITNLVDLGINYHKNTCENCPYTLYHRKFGSLNKEFSIKQLQNLSIGMLTGYNNHIIPDIKSITLENGWNFNSDIDKTIYRDWLNIGGFIDYRLTFLNPRLFFRFESTYNQFKTSKNFKFASQSSASGKLRMYDFELFNSSKFIDNTFLIKYSLFNSKNDGWYISGGYSLSYFIENTFQRKGKYNFEFNNIERQQSLDTDLIHINNFKYSHKPVIGLGYYRKYNSLYLSTDIRYQSYMYKTISNDVFIEPIDYKIINTNTHEISINLGIGFYFKK